MPKDADDELDAPLPEEAPTSFASAETRADVLTPTRPGDPEGARKMVYYRQPVVKFLRSLGCPADELEDLTHDILIRLTQGIAPAYQGRGPFRDYFKQSIRNAWRDLHRARRRRPEGRDPAILDQLSSARDSSRPLEGALARGCDVLRAYYRQAQGREADGAELLLKVVLEGARQRALAAELGLSERRVRARYKKAGRAFLSWLRQRFPATEPDELAGLPADRLLDARSLNDESRAGLLILFGRRVEEG